MNRLRETATDPQDQLPLQLAGAYLRMAVLDAQVHVTDSFAAFGVRVIVPPDSAASAEPAVTVMLLPFQTVLATTPVAVPAGVAMSLAPGRTPLTVTNS